MDTDPLSSPNRPDLPRRDAILFAALTTAVGFTVRLAGIFHRVLWQDEIDFWIGALSTFRSDQAGPLPFLLYGFVCHLFSRTDPFMFRWISVIVGAAAIPAAYLLGRMVLNRRTGALASLIVALTPTSWYWSQELRPYALFQLLVSVTMAAFIGGYVRDRSGWRVVFFFGMASCFATHLLTVPLALGLVAFGVLSLASRHSRADLHRWGWLVLSLAVAAALGLFWIRYRWRPISGVMTGEFVGSPLSFARDVMRALGPVGVGQLGRVLFVDIFAAAVFLLAVGGCVSLIRLRSRVEACLIPVVIFAVVGALYLELGEKSQWLWNRYLVAVVPLFAVLMAVGFDALTERRTTFVRWVALALLVSFYVPPLVRFSREGQVYPGVTAKWAAPVIAQQERRLKGVIVLGSKRALPERVLNAYCVYRRDHLPCFFVAATGVTFFDDIVMSHPPVLPVVGRAYELPLPPAGRYAVVTWFQEHTGDPCVTLATWMEPGACQAVTWGKVFRGVRFVIIGKGDAP